MGSDAASVVGIPSPRDIKVHRLMCMELIKFVTRVSMLLPAIEKARPGCNSGIQVLCQLTRALDKAKDILQHCSESSKLYLALTGDVILSRCKKSRNLLEQSLNSVQNMVPVMLATEISQLVDDLRARIFSLDPSEAEARKVLSELLHQYTSTTHSGEEHVFQAIQIAMRSLRITSPKDLLIEKRSIKKQLEKVGGDSPAKRKILLFFLNLLNKNGKSIVAEHAENGTLRHEDSLALENQFEVESRLRFHHNDAQRDIFNCSLIPDEFKCPLSSRLMYDPVVIASGQTYERYWIAKWFTEGNDTCPRTKKKLVHLSLTPNNSMRDLISRWTTAHGVSVLDPSVQAAVGHSRESSSASIASLSNSMMDLSLPIDFSNLSLGYSEAGPASHSSHAKTPNDFSVVSLESSGNFHKVQSGESFNEIELDRLARLNLLSWESQCSLVGNIRNMLKQNGEARDWMLSEKFIQKLIRFLEDAHKFHYQDAQLLGCQSLLAVLDECGSSLPYLNDDAFALLTLLLGSEVSKEALVIFEVLSRDHKCHHKFAASGALSTILEILDAQSRELQEPAIKILCNMSGSCKIGSWIAPSELVPKLVPFLEDTALARYCVIILDNLCIKEDARIAIAETAGCITSIVKLLQRDNRKDQEHAVALLLSLCSQRAQYCQLVMDEEPFFSELLAVSVNGNNKAKGMALELLRLLRSDIGESYESDIDIPKTPVIDSTQQKSCSKATGIFGKFFSKRRSPANKRIK
ncbi:U-box domain-containing protein 5 isoform X1 [Lycium ferocissimum]|uniref:U-box domain-containing protein 5 isoform X1 n=2 Tax=Lycium ferocissimum TaxID=112874 RepID=UPI002815F72B|nr:U-box domain-containing protein 5 isoform X1 [Lycium ferocissimum]XP_059293183.1 U-box domain-containing protein 5 isoform X1 [Lycium ferocissimum]